LVCRRADTLHNIAMYGLATRRRLRKSVSYTFKTQIFYVTQERKLQAADTQRRFSGLKLSLKESEFAEAMEWFRLTSVRSLGTSVTK